VAFLFSYRWVPYAGLAFLLAALLGLGTMGQIGTWRSSRDLWERVTRVYPAENPAAYSKLGLDYLRARKYDEAQEAFSRACALPPPLAEAANGLGMALMYKGMVAGAALEFQQALSLDPHLNAARLNLWTVYERQGRYEEAVGQMKAALQIEPNSPLIHDKLGVSEGFLKKFADAQRALGKAHQLDPDNSVYLAHLAMIYQQEGNPEKAIEWYRQAILHNPGEPLYDLRTADIYRSLGMKAKALEYLRKAWNLETASPQLIQEIKDDFGKVGEPPPKDQGVDGGVKP
jgi:tetratricopeptide (TPR) repeat protein